MQLNFLYGDDGRAYFIKGHVPFDEFMTAVRQDLCDDQDSILGESPVHCWMRVCYDFGKEQSIYVEAAPNSRGAFKATWLQDS